MLKGTALCYNKMGVTFPEKIDVKRAEFICSLNKKEKEKLIWDDCEGNHSNKGEPYLNKKTYLKQVTQYCSDAINSGGTMEIKYNYSKKMQTAGRMFASQFSMQGMEKKLRSFLAADLYVDYDLWNAHFCIVASILITHLGGEAPFKKQFKLLWTYTQSQQQRELVQRATECDKIQLLEMLNSNFCPDDLNERAKRFNYECKEAQRIMFDETPSDIKQYKHFKSLSVHNKKGSFLNKIMCVIENKILKQVIDHYAENYEDRMTATLMFDGLYISSELPCQVETLNQITEHSGFVWTQKDGSDYIENSECYKNRDELPAYEIKSYESVKEKFEENHFIIEKTATYVRETTVDGLPEVHMYNAADFKMVVKPIKFEVYKGGRLETVSIFEPWSGDATRRAYKRLDFIPEITNSTEVYNTFTGFDFADYETADYIPSTKLIDYFTKTISTLVDHDEASKVWITRFIADIIQNPTRLPGCAVLLKSRQGFGKDTIMDCVSKLLNKQYLFRTARPDDIFGAFNGVIANKLIIQLNEMEGKDGFANKEKLKNLITELTTKINEKNIKAYPQTNTARVWIMSNNSHPVEIPNGDRRFAVFEADRIKPPASFFIEMRLLMDDVNELYSLYEYLATYDLGDVALRDSRPITKAYNIMQSISTHPFYTWLDGFVIDASMSEIADLFTVYRYSKNKEKLMIAGSEIFDAFKEYMDESEQPMYKFNQKRVMKDMLAQLKVYGSPAKMNGSVVASYLFVLKDARILIKEFIDNDDDEEMDLDNDPEW